MRKLRRHIDKKTWDEIKERKAAGVTGKQIAKECNISTATVSRHGRKLEFGTAPMGRKSFFSEGKELQKVIQAFLKISKRKHVSCKVVMMKMARILECLGLTNRFKSGMPSKNWAVTFCKKFLRGTDPADPVSFHRKGSIFI